MKSDNVKKGIQQAPHRSLFYALGYTPEELERPLVGIVSSWNEIVPGITDADHRRWLSARANSCRRYARRSPR